MWVIGGNTDMSSKNDVWYSTDGETWIQATASAAFSPRYEHTSVVFDNRMWVIGGSTDSIVWYSTDGETWIQATASAAFSPRSEHYSVVFDKRMWVIGGWNGTYSNSDVWYSSDGVTWTQATASAAFACSAFSCNYRESPRWSTSVVFNNRMWVIGGSTHIVRSYKYDIWSSTDGVTWIQPRGPFIFSPRYGHTSVVFDNKMWVIAGEDWNDGYKMDVWYSADGVIWTRATNSAAFSPRSMHTSLVFDNRVWVIGGWTDSEKKDVWYSTDGITWTQATDSAAFSLQFIQTSVVFDNKMWIIGVSTDYNNNEVWYSTDGITWTQATDSAAFSHREGYTFVVFNNRIWLIGGFDGNNYRNDVWSSSDGAHWTQVIASTTFSPRAYHQVVVADNKMWLIGGFDNSNYYNDVWTSTDGVTWTEDSSNAGFLPREGFTAVTFRDKLWVIGGYTHNLRFGYCNDVWYREVPPTQQMIVDVRDTVTGSLIPNATVGLYDPNHSEWQNATTPTGTLVFTDSGAAHQYPLVIGTNYNVAASAGGYVPVVRNVTFVQDGQRETVEMGKVPGGYSFSITQVGNPGREGFEDISSAIDLDATMLSLALEQDTKVTWTPAFWKKETSVTKEDLGTNGGGLNDAIFHYHAGHGAKDLIFWGNTYLALSNGQSLYTTEVERKWGGNNKWVYLDSCDILSDQSWSKALSTTHGIFGYTTPKYTGAKEKTDFIQMAQGRTYPLAAPKPLSKAFYNATRQNQPSSVTAAVIFGNKDQYDKDYLPGHGSIAADKDPNDRSYFYADWPCAGPEVKTS
jgi:hypothetical protein